MLPHDRGDVWRPGGSRHLDEGRGRGHDRGGVEGVLQEEGVCHRRRLPPGLVLQGADGGFSRGQGGAVDPRPQDVARVRLQLHLEVRPAVGRVVVQPFDENGGWAKTFWKGLLQ